MSRTYPQVVNLMRFHKPTKVIVTMAQCVTRFPGEYVKLWTWIGGDCGAVHPHPHCLYWIENPAESAQRTSEDHLLRGEN